MNYAISLGAFSLNRVLETGLENAVNFFVIILELMGLTVIAVTAVKAFYSWIKKTPKPGLTLRKVLQWLWNLNWAVRF